LEVKGMAIIPIKDYVTSKFNARYQEWLDSLSPTAQNIMRNPLSSSWYPLQPALVEPTKRVCDLFHKGSDHGAWEMGRDSADLALKGPYSIYIKKGEPEFIISRGSRVIAQYYRPCEMKVTENQSKPAILQITQFPELDHLIELRIAGWLERA
jgi:hypothetical protein